MHNIQSNEIQVDEIWGFIGKKKRQTKAWERSVGDVWTFIAMDADSKTCGRLCASGFGFSLYLTYRKIFTIKCVSQ